MDSRFVEVEGHRVHWLEAGEGPAVVLLHGWPTASFLYRDVAPLVAEGNRVLVPDLIGFGKSDKPLDVSYSFRFHERILSAWLEAVGVDRFGLVVHDLGGPIGLYWACMHKERITSLVLLNTLVYPRPSWAVVAFVLAAYTPFVRMLLAGPRGLEFAMDWGTTTSSKLSPAVYEGVKEPFTTRAARKALLKAGVSLTPKGMMDIARILPTFECPVRCIYGEKDRVLPDVARTMIRVQRDLPQTELIPLPACGHFLQEEKPEEIGELLAEFFGRA